MIDYHIHTDVSPDANQALGDVVIKARDMGITHIAVTDHYDYFDDHYDEAWTITDLAGYSKEIDKYKNKHDDIYIAKGIEVGHINCKKNEISAMLNTVDFDFIISSIHIINGYDPYLREYYKGKTKEESYYEYLKATSDSIDHMDSRTSVLGHIGYVTRYAPYDDCRLSYEEFPEIIDEILLKAIKRGFGIEINTSNYGRKPNESMPSSSIVKRYKQLGGEIITIGSDAHNLSYIGRKYDKAKEIAVNAGFEYLSIFKNLKPEFIKI